MKLFYKHTIDIGTLEAGNPYSEFNKVYASTKDYCRTRVQSVVTSLTTFRSITCLYMLEILLSRATLGIDTNECQKFCWKRYRSSLHNTVCEFTGLLWSRLPYRPDNVSTIVTKFSNVVLDHELNDRHAECLVIDGCPTFEHATINKNRQAFYIIIRHLNMSLYNTKFNPNPEVNPCVWYPNHNCNPESITEPVI